MKILLHTCCGICAGHCVAELLAQGHEPTLFYSNANIAPHKEFEKRLVAVKKLAEHFGVPVIVTFPIIATGSKKLPKVLKTNPSVVRVVRAVLIIRSRGRQIVRGNAVSTHLRLR